jgi:hypothetical protein
MHDSCLLYSTDHLETRSCARGRRLVLTVGARERWRKRWGVAEELEADLSWHHGCAGELPAVRVDGDGFRDRTDGAPTTTNSACCLDTGKRRGEF